MRGLDSSLLLVGRKAFWNLPWAQRSAFETGGEGKETTPPDQSVLSAKGLSDEDAGRGRAQRKEGATPVRTHPLFQLPGLLSPEQHLVPGLLVGVCHQRVSVVRPQLRKEQLSGRAGPGHVWGRAGAAGGVGGGVQRGSCPEVGWAGAAPHPLPGLLQVVPQDFSNLLLLVLGECWQDALSRQVLGVDVPGTT